MKNKSSTYDLIICGAGPSGMLAALASAKLGLKTLLVEQHGFFGGMNTAALVGPIMTFHAGTLQIVRGLAGELFEKLKARGGTPGHLKDPIWGTTTLTPVDTEIYKALLIEEASRSGMAVLFHSLVVKAHTRGNRISKITLSSKKGLEELSARFFIDATGDGDLAASARASFVMGQKKNHLTQPMTLIFKLRGVNWMSVYDALRSDPKNFYLGVPLDEYLSLPARAVSGFFREVAEGKKRGEFPADRDRLLFFGTARADEATINTLRITGANGTLPRDLTRAEMLLREQVPKLAEFFRKRIPGFENSFVAETAAQIGVRETRHILGDYLLKAEDILNLRRFPDVIAHASYPIDIHSPSGAGLQHQDPFKKKPNSFYDIPLRTLIPKKFTNLLVTGRCISAEHEASASARISATCMALGEASAACVFSALSKHKTSLRDVDIRLVQKTILDLGGFLTF